MDNQISAIGVLSLLETTKEQRESFVRSIVSALDDGQVDPLKVHLQVKNTEDLIKQITADEKYREFLLNEAQKYGKSFEQYNAKFQVKETGTRYDYSGCNDALLTELEEKAAFAAERLKERQKFLQNLPASGLEVLQGDELVTVYPPVKTSTTSVTVTLK
jgi:hypothetical protein